MFIKATLENLRDKINKHNHYYYVLGKPAVSDAEYDELYNNLVSLEKAYPDLVTPTSPTQRVGSDLSGELPTKKHHIPMLSLSKATSPEELNDFVYKPEFKGQIFSVGPKFDGLSFSAIYEEGFFSMGLTRGSGTEGQVISHAIRTIRSLPLEISYKKPLEVRGEIYIPKLTFDRINSDGKYSSARNLAAGSVKLLDCAEVARRGLDVVIYSAFLEEEFQKESEQLEFLRELGFKVLDYRLFDDLKEIIKYCLELEQTRGDFPFDMDGVVVKIDDFGKRKELSYTSTHPRFATAFKFKAQSKGTVLREVRWQVSRNGILTPVGLVNPVFLDGARLTNATLHNVEFAEKFRLGSTVELVRSGEVIPKIIGTLVEGDGPQVKPPSVCPDCGAPTEIRPPIVVCLGTNCLSQVIEKVIHYAEKDSLDIRGLGDVIVEDLVRAGKVKTPADLYYLRKEDLLELPGFADKKAENILTAIKKSKNPPLDKFLHGLGIPYTGVNTSRNLAKTFKTIRVVMNATYEQLITIQDIGETTADGIVDFFRDNRKFVESLLDAGVVPQTEETVETGTSLSGKSFVITGTLSQPRSYYEKLIAENGGKVASGVSSKTDYLVAGENTGVSKTSKARELGVKVIGETELLEMIG